MAKAVRFGMTNSHIAERLLISPEAVKFHVANILAKLRMSARAQLRSWSIMPAQISSGEEQNLDDPTERKEEAPVLIPPGFTRVFPYIFAENARAYLDFLAHGLDGEIVDIHAGGDGVVRNAHVRFGDTTIMVSEATEARPASQATFYLYVADADAAMAKARAAGGVELTPVNFRPYGERQGGVRDPSGNIWWLSQRLAPGGY